jgi:hypothetical protein
MWYNNMSGTLYDRADNEILRQNIAVSNLGKKIKHPAFLAKKVAFGWHRHSITQAPSNGAL